MNEVIVVPSTVGGWDVRVPRGATFSHHPSREEAERAAKLLRERGPRLRKSVAQRRPS